MCDNMFKIVISYVCFVMNFILKLPPQIVPTHILRSKLSLFSDRMRNWHFRLKKLCKNTFYEKSIVIFNQENVSNVR